MIRRSRLQSLRQAEVFVVAPVRERGARMPGQADSIAAFRGLLCKQWLDSEKDSRIAVIVER
jgi:hypothetical protein